MGYLCGQDEATVDFPESQARNPLLANLFWSTGLDMDLVLFCGLMDLNSILLHMHTQKELGQFSAIVTSCLVNNPYVQPFIIFLMHTYNIDFESSPFPLYGYFLELQIAVSRALHCSVMLPLVCCNFF